VKWSSPAFQLTHEKSLVVDGKSALIMTLNLVHSAFTRNREYGIITHDPVEVREVLEGFNADWSRTKLTPPAHSALLWSPVDSRQKLLTFIDGARQSLVLEQEEMQDVEIQRHLADAAKRGVAVRALVAAPFADSGGADPNLRGERQLESAGATVRTLDQPTLHAKMWLADGGRAIVGSVNVSKSSLDDNRELAIEVSDPAIIRRIAQTFEKDWAVGAPIR
jgi:cardiolipin synthase A/B